MRSVRFSLQWLELVEISRVLLRILVERTAFAECDVIKLAEIVVSSTPERGPVQFSKQWPELFERQIYIRIYLVF